MDKPILRYFFPSFWPMVWIIVIVFTYSTVMDVMVNSFSNKTVVHEGQCVLSWDSTINSISALCPFDREIRLASTDVNIARLASGELVECKILTNSRREFQECK